MEGVTELVQSPAGMTDGELYEYDFPAWCDLQAERLRRAAATVGGQDQPDWPHLIEEVEDMGAAERHRVESLLVQAMVHLMKLQGAPNGPDSSHWIIETRAFLDDAASAFAPSMRRMIDMDRLYQRALFRLTGKRILGQCPFPLDDLIGPFPDVAALAAKIPPLPAG